MPVLAYNHCSGGEPEQPRRLVWLVDSLDRLTSFPPAVGQKLGFALYQAQIGQKHESATMLHGFAETVWQVRADDPGGTYRAVYVTTFGKAVFVLHAFQKKSTSGIATPRRELELIRQRPCPYSGTQQGVAVQRFPSSTITTNSGIRLVSRLCACTQLALLLGGIPSTYRSQ
jgi:phage-related protein